MNNNAFTHSFQLMRFEAQQLSVNYQHNNVIDNLTVEFPKGQVTSIVGPNGCGKSTLLASLARLHEPSKGTVFLNERSIYKQKARETARQIALLPQQLHAPSGLDVLSLIRFGRQPYQHWYSQWSEEDARSVEAAIQATNLQDLVNQPLENLSGGQRQRAWLAMTIAQSTPILLLDEPTAALDLGHQIEVFELIQRLAKQQQKTIIMVVHDLSNACRYSDHMIAMLNGKMIAQGTPQAVVTPSLVQQMYQIDCQLITDPLTNTPVLTQLKPMKSA